MQNGSEPEEPELPDLSSSDGEEPLYAPYDDEGHDTESSTSLADDDAEYDPKPGKKRVRFQGAVQRRSITPSCPRPAQRLRWGTKCNIQSSDKIECPDNETIVSRMGSALLERYNLRDSRVAQTKQLVEWEEGTVLHQEFEVEKCLTSGDVEAHCHRYDVKSLETGRKYRYVAEILEAIPSIVDFEQKFLWQANKAHDADYFGGAYFRAGCLRDQLDGIQPHQYYLQEIHEKVGLTAVGCKMQLRDPAHYSFPYWLYRSLLKIVESLSNLGYVLRDIYPGMFAYDLRSECIVLTEFNFTYRRTATMPSKGCTWEGALEIAPLSFLAGDRRPLNLLDNIESAWYLVVHMLYHPIWFTDPGNTGHVRNAKLHHIGETPAAFNGVAALGSRLYDRLNTGMRALVRAIRSYARDDVDEVQMNQLTAKLYDILAKIPAPSLADICNFFEIQENAINHGLYVQAVARRMEHLQARHRKTCALRAQQNLVDETVGRHKERAFRLRLKDVREKYRQIDLNQLADDAENFAGPFALPAEQIQVRADRRGVNHLMSIEVTNRTRRSRHPQDDDSEADDDDDN
ncbi:unnamed protein product, partial [Mesorhabditis spiculigera]